MICILTSKGLNQIYGEKIIKKALELRFDKRSLQKYYIGLVSLKKYQIDSILVNAAFRLGFRNMISICTTEDVNKMKYIPDCWYFSEGNTFELLDFIRRSGLESIIKKSDNKIIIGASSGAVICSDSISVACDFDRNLVSLKNMRGLNLIPHSGRGLITLIPHYTQHEMQRWKKNTQQEFLSRFDTILNVSNNQFLLIDSTNPERIIKGRI